VETQISLVFTTGLATGSGLNEKTSRWIYKFFRFSLHSSKGTLSVAFGSLSFSLYTYLLLLSLIE
jgi:hypothetical protein